MMPAFILHVLGAILLGLAAIQPATGNRLRLRIGFGGMALWMVADLVAQWAAFGPPWR